ncbi:5042_t:CDS:2, partial [Racocetra persica]
PNTAHLPESFLISQFTESSFPNTHFTSSYFVDNFLWHKPTLLTITLPTAFSFSCFMLLVGEVSFSEIAVGEMGCQRSEILRKWCRRSGLSMKWLSMKWVVSEIGGNDIIVSKPHS